MKTNNLFKAVTYIAATLLLVGCVVDNNETLSDNSSTTPVTIGVVVNMPANSPQTCISLEQDWLDINLAWKTVINWTCWLYMELSRKDKELRL